MSFGHQKWAKNLFWGQGRDYDDAWSMPRSDCGNEYRQKLFYDIATRVQPRLSRGIRIIGGDVVPGVSDNISVPFNSSFVIQKLAASTSRVCKPLHLMNEVHKNLLGGIAN